MRLEGIIVDRLRQHQRGAVLDAEFIERLGDVQPGTVSALQFVGRGAVEATRAPPPQILVNQIDNVVYEYLDGNRGRIDL